MKRTWRTTALIAIAALLTLILAACDVSRPALSVTAPSASEIIGVVPGSSGIGKPPGVIEVRYTLGKSGQVTIRLAQGAAMDIVNHIETPTRIALPGTTITTLLAEHQNAGEHILRFNGVIATDEISRSYRIVRQVVPDGDYVINIATDETNRSVGFKVLGSDTQPPDLAHMVVHPDTISPNSDAVDDVAEVTFRTDQTSTLSVDLTHPNGTRTPMLAPIKRGPGEHNAVISGQNVLGEVLPDGTYTVTVRAQDAAGNMVESQRPLKVEGGGEPQIEITRIDISPQQIILGQPISVSITVKNTGNVPLRTQGPDPGYTYTTNDSYSSIEGSKWIDKAGLWRVGVDWDGNSGGGGAYRYPFRWGFVKTLMPGEEVTTGGKIVILKQERQMWFYAGVLQEGIRIVLDRLGRTPIGIDF
ncbi:MAG TPA: hypothetical protein VJ183_08810 [Chloroflexia bacterium]|nr:hypothetical protein [Chloroflexia bacterium]